MEMLFVRGNDLSQIKKIIKTREVFDEKIIEDVHEIVKNVKKDGDKALLDYTEKFDKVCFCSHDLLVTEQEFSEAKSKVSDEIKQTILFVKKNIEKYQQEYKKKSWKKKFSKGVYLGNLVRPLDKVGVYIPGGTAPLVSTVLMTVVPAKVAEVEEIIVVTPPGKDGKINPNILFACSVCGVDKVYKAGGAHAIASLAFGTETIPKVDKIVGPGNIYVTLAKKEVYGYVDIDMVAGPSEIMVVADENVNPKWVAADLMSQAEHDLMASCFLLCFSEDYANKVKNEFELLLQDMSRADIIKESWEKNGKIFIVENDNQIIDIINLAAPEHLELMVKNPDKFILKIKNAGAVFIGNYTPEAIGDYVAGPSHVLPTSGSAKYFSVLNTEDFYKNISLISYNKKAFYKQAHHASLLAELEGLMAHKASIDVRY